MNLKDLTKSSALYSLGGIAIKAVGFLMIPIYTHYLTPADYGTLELIEQVTSVVAIVFGLMAIGNAMTRIYHDKKDPVWQASVISTTVFGTGALVSLVCLFGMLAAPLLAGFVFGVPTYGGLLRATFASLLVSMLMEVGLAYLRIRDRAWLFVSFSLIHFLVTLGLNIIFIVGMGWGVWGFVLSKLIATGAGCIYMLVTVLREVGLRWNGEAARRMVRFGAPLVLGGVATFVVHFADRFFLTPTAGLAAVGVYALAYKFGFLVSDLVGAPFARAWGARFYELTDDEGWEARFMEVFRGLMFVTIVAWTGLAMFIPEIVSLMADAEYHGAAVFVPLLALGYVARTAGDFFADILYINKRSFTRARITAITAVANTVLNLLLIPRYGVWGATWATFGTWIFYVAIAAHRALREFRFVVPLRGMIVLGGIAGATFATSHFFSPAHLALALLFKSGLGLVALGAAWRWFDWTPGQKEAIRAASRRIWARWGPGEAPSG